MPTKFVHTNIIAKDYKKLADFYIEVFDCKPAGKEFALIGDWLKKGANVPSGKLQGINLTLPGYDKDGPKLEIFQYDDQIAKSDPPAANRESFGHIAFHVDDVETILEKLLAAGGKNLGEVVAKEFNQGTLTFVYALDPEDNIIEIQNWTPKS